MPVVDILMRLPGLSSQPIVLRNTMNIYDFGRITWRFYLIFMRSRTSPSQSMTVFTNIYEIKPSPLEITNHFRVIIGHWFTKKNEALENDDAKEDNRGMLVSNWITCELIRLVNWLFKSTNQFLMYNRIRLAGLNVNFVRDKSFSWIDVLNQLHQLGLNIFNNKKLVKINRKLIGGEQHRETHVFVCQ